MNSKGAENTKEKLTANFQNFKKLEAAQQQAKEDFAKKLLKEINIIDKQEEQFAQKLAARKKALALKNQKNAPYFQEGNSPEEVPVDGDVRAGTMVFMKNCASCHSMQPVDIRPMKGPSLALTYNRRAGSNTTYQFYTQKLLESTFFWSAKNLYNFMDNPASLVPKTSCDLLKSPLRSEQDRADLIAMFREYTSQMIFNVRMKEIQRVGYTVYQSNLHVEQKQRQRGKMRDKRDKKIDNAI